MLPPPHQLLLRVAILVVLSSSSSSSSFHPATFAFQQQYYQQPSPSSPRIVRSAAAAAAAAAADGSGNHSLPTTSTTNLTQIIHKYDELSQPQSTEVNQKRRSLLMMSFGLLGGMMSNPFLVNNQAHAFSFAKQAGPRESKVFFVSSDKNASDSLKSQQVDLDAYALNAELCLLKLLPVKNPVFRELERSVIAVSTLKTVTDPGPWKKAQQSMVAAIETLDTKRSKLEPVFNPEEDTMIQIIKGERGEQLIEEFRTQLVCLNNATTVRNITETLIVQKRALLALADVGEFLVKKFPYDVPTEGLYSYLPRLVGRAKVTFTMRRKKKILGNITIIADGFAAPITAGNFVDLSIRNFYTGLPVKLARKKVGSGNEFEVASIPILGSFNEGFFDPLTARLRRIPLEIIRIEKEQGTPKLSYAEDDASNSVLPGRLLDFSDKPASVSEERNGRSLLSFDIPGLVALNHPDKALNSGSSEFFSLQLESLPENKRRLLDGEYAPFGYIVDGYDLFLSLVPGDIIESTNVDDLGQLNLLKLRQSSFSEVVQATEQNFGKEEPAKNNSSDVAK